MRKNVVKNSGTTVKNKTKKIARSSISYTIYLFFAVFWGCHCIWASASVRGHPREKHLVYVVGAGSRATHCKNAAANGLPLAEKTAKSHSKCHAIGFFGAVSSRSSHRSVGHRLPCGRRRSETKSGGSGPCDVGLWCPRFSPGRASSEYRAAAARLCLYAFRGTAAGIRGGSGAVLSPTGLDMAYSSPRAAEIESLNIAPLLPDFGSISSASDGRPIEPKSGS